MASRMLKASVLSFSLGLITLILGAVSDPIPGLKLTFEISRVIFFLLLTIAVLTFIFSLGEGPARSVSRSAK